MVNLAAAEGHPAAVIDMSFANQALCAAYLAAHYDQLANAVYGVPSAVDQEVANLKLTAMGIDVDQLSAAQKAYLASWREGT